MSDENNAQVLREVVRTCVRKLGLLQKADAACCGITVAQCHTLIEIGRKNTLSLNELSESLTLDKSTMSRTVDNLVNIGLVERQSDKQDRRYTKITLTENGSKMVELINGSMEEYFARVLRSVPEEKQDVVIEALPYLLTAVRDTDMSFNISQVCFGNQAIEKGGCDCE
ncbi:MarR family winged helix-turn-helix transcriptional regulator [Sporomusa malonica]|uniref:DNA-binding transcriptional regulator, MarR family n=1 Tax=Sporomusa malonica TaxID=112901 RepID=A0A1W1Z9G4_9FIRM|nr:MarR family transcriptional regulator [Sporomusa malonica]SMC45044.1 DNA-binding transcriptional regulator, MarR family [Sporomusa malonica]